jgi:hypothetical protein
MELFFAVMAGGFLVGVGFVVLMQLLEDLYHLLKELYFRWKLKRVLLKIIKNNEEVLKMLGDD